MAISVKNTIQNKALVAFILIMAALLIVGFWLWSNLKEVTRSNERVEINSNTLFQIGDMISNAKDLEVGARGFLITRDFAMQQPYFLAKQKLEDNILAMDTMIISPENRAYLGKVEALVKGIEDVNGEIIKLVLNDSQNLASTLYIYKGKVKMDSLRTIVRKLGNNYQEKIAASVDMQNDALRQTFTFVLLIFLLIFGTLIFTFLSLRNDVIGRSKAQMQLNKVNAELAELNATLESQVQERTEDLKRSYEELELKVKFRNLALQKEVSMLKKKLGEATGSL